MSRMLAYFAAAFGCLTATVCTAQNSAKRDVIGNVPGRGMSIRRTQQASQPSSVAGDATKRALRKATHPEMHSPLFVGVMGQVVTPGVFEFTTKAPNLQDLIECAGGRTQFASGEYYVVSATRPLTRIDPIRNANARFVNGDVLLVETSARNYHELGRPGTTLATLHPRTQVALFNVTDRPVILNSLKPQQARLSSLLTMLGQTQRATRGLRTIVPPNSREIPATAVAPDLITSGTSLIFDPESLDRARLPSNWPRALAGVSIKKASHQGEVPPPPVPPDSNVTSHPSQQLADASAWSLPLPQDERPQQLPSPETKEFTSLETPQSMQIFESDQALAPGASHTAKQRKSDAVVAGGEALPKEIDVDAGAAKSATDDHSMLSSQQRGYVIGFFVIVALFGIAYWVRQRGAAYGYAARKFAYSMNHQGSPAEARPAEVRTGTVHMTPKAEPLTEGTLLREPTTERDERPKEPSMAEQAAASESTSEPVQPAMTPLTATAEAEPAVTASPAPAEEAKPKPATAPVDKLEAEPAPATVEPPVVEAEPIGEPETTLDLELFEKLIEGRLKIEREPAESITIAKELRHPVAAPPEHPVETVVENTASPSAEPQAAEPQPLFPIIWNRATQPESQPAELRRFVPPATMDDAESVPEHEAPLTEPDSFDEMRPDAILPERVDDAEPAIPRPKMLDRGAKRGALLDRVLQTVHRERKK